LALHEILVKNEAMGRAIQRGAKAAEVRDLAVAGGMRTLIQDGIEKSIAGLTDLKQVLTVVGNR
jgi:type IV pilus assembly protein PilB